MLGQRGRTRGERCGGARQDRGECCGGRGRTGANAIARKRDEWGRSAANGGRGRPMVDFGGTRLAFGLVEDARDGDAKNE